MKKRKAKSVKLKKNKSAFFFAFSFSLLAFFARDAFSQGSPYGLIGYGEPIVTTNPRIEGLAGSGTALLDPRNINDINPASWSWLNRTRIEAGMRFSTTRSDLGADESLLHRTKLGGFAFGSPISEHYGLAIALGFNPLTYTDAETIHNDSLASTQYIREGGLSQIFVGASIRPVGWLALGARFDALFGNTRDLSKVTPTDANAVVGEFERDYSTSGLRGTFGVVFALDSLVPSLGGVTIAGKLSTGATLNIIRRTFVTPTSRILDSTIEDEGSALYPAAIALGIASRLGDRYRIEADYFAQDYTGAKVYFGPTSSTTDSRLSSGTRFSLGFERLPLMGEDAKGFSFWQRLGVRFGGSYGTLPYKPDGKTLVNETTLSFGFNVPINYESQLDFAITGGMRSPQTIGASPKDMFIRASGSISISEKWFTPLRRDED